MDDLKRYFTKYIRDRAKSGYDKGTECFICGSTEDLDFHHYYSLSILVANWLKERDLEIETAEDALEWRDVFIAEHLEELYKHAVTLCHEHHLKLHSIYGRNPRLGTAPKQERWVGIQRDKHNALV